MNDLEYLCQSVKQLECFYSELSNSKSIEALTWKQDIQQFRHERYSELLLIFLKGVRSVSLLNACMILFRAGHVHEIGVLCRCLDEAQEDMILFMRNLGDEGRPSKDQVRALSEFFQEQFLDPYEPFGTTVKRDRVPRSKIRAAIARLPENVVNPHDHSTVLSTIDDAMSGYVHGAYPHIMDIYGGDPARFHMSGMARTPRMLETLRQMILYVHRAALVTWYAAKRLEEDAVATRVFQLRKEMEARYPSLVDDPVAAINEMKSRAKERDK